VLVNDIIETDADIEDDSDDMDTNENPFAETANAINFYNLDQIEQKTNKVPCSIVHNSMIHAKNRQLGYQSPVKKLFQLKYSASILNSEVIL
jgi:hypothetical protein